MLPKMTDYADSLAKYWDCVLGAQTWDVPYIFVEVQAATARQTFVTANLESGFQLALGVFFFQEFYYFTAVDIGL